MWNIYTLLYFTLQVLYRYQPGPDRGELGTSTLKGGGDSLTTTSQRLRSNNCRQDIHIIKGLANGENAKLRTKILDLRVEYTVIWHHTVWGFLFFNLKVWPPLIFILWVRPYRTLLHISNSSLMYTPTAPPACTGKFHGKCALPFLLGSCVRASIY